MSGGGRVNRGRDRRSRSVGHERPSAVAIGGGHGLARTLRALPQVVDESTAVVTVADDGGSSGRLRRDLGVLPPGDLRMAVVALARERRLAQLLQYRFPRGELGGHSLGNLVLVALEDLVGGDLQAALDELCRVLDVPGRVLPCTTTPVVLHGATPDGRVRGQVAVASTPRPRARLARTGRAPRRPRTWCARSAGRTSSCSDRGRSTPACCPTCSCPGVARRARRGAAPGRARRQPARTARRDRGHVAARPPARPASPRPRPARSTSASPTTGRVPARGGARCDGGGLDGLVGRVVPRDLLDGGTTATIPRRSPARVRRVLLGGPEPAPSPTTVRQELARLPLGSDARPRAELAALFRFAGSLTVTGGGTGGRRRLEVVTGSGAVARRTFALLQRRYGVRPELLVRAPGGVQRRSTYGVRVEAGAGRVAQRPRRSRRRRPAPRRAARPASGARRRSPTCAVRCSRPARSRTRDATPTSRSRRAAASGPRRWPT